MQQLAVVEGKDANGSVSEPSFKQFVAKFICRSIRCVFDLSLKRIHLKGRFVNDLTIHGLNQFLKLRL